MAKFTYNNTENVSTSHTLFELNYEFHSWVLFENNSSSHFRSYLANKLADKLKELIEIGY